jgi:hypothetical protein
MSFTALRQAAFGARRIYTVGGAADAKLGEKGGSDMQTDRTRSDTKPSITLEPHWQAAIESATD